MNLLDLVFVIIFIADFALLLIFGFSSFYFNYLKYLRLKKMIAIDEIKTSNIIKEKLESPFWVYGILLDQELMDESSVLVSNNKKLRSIHKKYKYFLNLQLLSFVVGIGVFIFYVAIKIVTAWVS